MFFFCIFLIFLPFQLLKLRLVRDRIFGHAKRPSINNVGGANTGNMETSEKLSRPQGRMREAIDGTGGDIDGTGGVRGAFSKTTKVSGRSDLREARACTIRWEEERKLDKHLLHTERRQCFRRRRKTLRAISCSLWMLGNIARQKSSISYRKALYSWVIQSMIQLIIHINP